MDVRQLDFLARQPSAALSKRDTFWGLPKRGLALLLANAMFWQPLWAQAEGIAVSGTTNTSLNQAGNGVPIVNIAAPNASGLSHNQYQQYNVDSQGVILNNITQQTASTQLGGIIVGNANLKNGAATTILNEVIGANASQLKGYTEVAGQSARVIVANPYGISCNGCGFINTPRVTLTTGTPMLDANGRLDRFQVDQGSVSIDGAGLNANNVDSFEIITRSTKINAEIQAKNLTIVAGRNDVNADSLNATARADDGSAKPQLAIDSSALGGMYAGAIKLVGTEAGVGVKLDGNLAASAGDIQIDANGHLNIAQTAASGAVNVRASTAEVNGPVYAGTSVAMSTAGDLATRQNVAARDSVTLTASGQLHNTTVIEAGVNADKSRNAAGDVTLSASSLTNSGSITASRVLQATSSQTLNNQGGTLNGRASTRIVAATVDNRQSGRILSQVGAVEINASRLLNAQDGLISSAGNTTLTAMSLGNAQGKVMADGLLTMRVTGAIDNQGGILGAGQGVDIHAVNLDNRQAGSVVSDGQMSLAIDASVDNRAGGALEANGLMKITSPTLDNRGGFIRANQGMQLFVDRLDNNQADLARQKGLIQSKAGLELTGTFLDNQYGLLNAAGLMQLKLSTVLNDKGRIASQADLVANIASLTLKGGELVAQGGLALTGTALDNRAGGLVGATKALKLNVDSIDNRGGEISSQVEVDLGAQTLDNSDMGKVLAGTALSLRVARLINLNKGLLFGDTLRLEGTDLTNTGGTLASQQAMTLLLAGSLNNDGGTISSEAALTVAADKLQNAAGNLSSAGALRIETQGALDNHAGSITTDATLTTVSASLDNSKDATLSGKRATTVSTGVLDNSQGGRLTSGDTLRLTAGEVINRNAGRIASALALTASVTSLDQQAGEMFSNTSLSLDLNHGQLNNQGGLINTPGALLLSNLADVANQNGEISSNQAFALAADSFDNSSGKLLSSQALTLTVAKALDNIKGAIDAAALDVKGGSLDNTDGLISSRAGLMINVATSLNNTRGTVIGDADVELDAAQVDNGLGQIASKKNLIARVGTLKQQGGELVAQGALTLTGDLLDNRQNGLIGATKALDIKVASIDNRGGELSSQDVITLTGAQLDNSDGGRVLAGNALNLNVARITNQNHGLLSSKAGLTLVGTGLDNTGGELRGLQGVDIDLSSLLDNSNGLISSEDVLRLKVGSLTNRAGNMSSAGAMNVASLGAVSNQGGKLVTDATLDLQSDSLDNRAQGIISGKGALNLKTGKFDNSQKGRVSSGDQLDLTAIQLTNRDGGSIGSSKALVASVSGLDQQNGSLFSNTSLSLDLNNGELDNQGGLINAPGTLLLNNLNAVLNQGGEISSAQAFTVDAQRLENSSGKLLSNQSLTLRIAQTLNNVKGMIAAAGVDASAASLDNTGGTLISRGDLGLTLNAATVNNSGDGLINSQGALNLTTTSLDTGSGGEVSALGAMTLTLSTLSLDAGRLLGDSALSVDLNGGDLNNLGGLVSAKGPLTLKGVRDFNNQAGEISSARGFTLAGRVLDNSNGKVISNDVLTVRADSVLNQNGLISGWQGLNVTGSGLDNRANGTLSSRNGSVSVNLTGALLNANGGALVSQTALTVASASIDNRGGILSSGSEQNLNVSGLLDNGQNGLIDSGASLIIKAERLNNSAGNLTAQQGLNFDGRSLDNSAGNLSSKGAMTLDLLEELTNSQGKLASGGALLLRRSTGIDNRGGQLASQTLMTLNTAGAVDNTNRGTLAANGTLLINAAGKLANDGDGLIYSQSGDLQVQAASVSNNGGTLQSQGALAIDTAGDIDNQNGRIIAGGGDLGITASSLDSRAGVLSSLQGAFTASITGVLKNGYNLNRQGGVIQAQRLNLSALGGFDNRGGRVSARSGDALINTANFDNSNGGLYATGLARVTGTDFNNAGDIGGQVAAGQVDLRLSGALDNRLGIVESDGAVNISAANLYNQNGQLRALGQSGATRFQIGNQFNNSSGRLEVASNDLILSAASFQNANGSLVHAGTGTFDISTANLTHAGGTVVTRGGLTLTADSWTNSSVIQAGRLTVNVGTLNQTASGQLLASTAFVGTGGNWVNDGVIGSDGTSDITLGGTYGGKGRVTSLGNLGVTAAQMDLSGPASIAGGGATIINVSGQLTNYGRLTSGDDLILSAGGVSNFGTLGAGQRLTVNTSSLLNNEGLLFSGTDMQINVSTFTNQSGDIYGFRNVTIAGYGSARANQVSNISGSMESGGQFSIAAAAFENRTQGTDSSTNFAVGRKLVSGLIAVQCIDCNKTHYEVNYIARETFSAGEDNDATASSLIMAGGDFSFNGGIFLNSKSTISAAGSITINADNVKNIGAMGGAVERTRIYYQGGAYTGHEVSVDTVRNFMPKVDAYNQRNNPDFPNIYYVNAAGELALAVPQVDYPMDDSNYIPAEFRDLKTGEIVGTAKYPVTLVGYQPGDMPKSQYDASNLVQLPSELGSLKLMSDLEVSKDGTGNAGRSAVIQAGGKVSITATQDLQNSVIHQDYTSGAGTSKVQDTRASGTGATVIRINAQLPPDRAQQQVNPLSLPGFSLPTGQNGLFRLSGQASNTAPVADAAGNLQNWTMGSAAISQAQRTQSVTDAQPGVIKLGSIGQIGSATRQFSQAARQNAGVSANATAFDTSAPGMTGGSVSLPGQPGAVAVSQTVAKVQGLPSSNFVSKPQKYLIETNPVLTDLKQFMSSDYLLSGLGYDPDVSAKRLGDGFYEQRLIQQAITARTGQAFIDGQNSNEAQFKYLMNNAIASKDALRLSVGVGLTSEQVAALTHDIVWLEEHEVNGEKVLVPVLYMAQANNRLGPTGALIAGNDVSLIAGQNLDNVGTLLASNNLSASAGNNLINTGLVQAGNRLDLLAGNDLVNKAGGIIAGRDISMTSLQGDIINERSKTSINDGLKYLRQSEIADSAARVEAANDLSITAGRDFSNVGSVLQSGRDTTIAVGRDVNITALELRDSLDEGSRKRTEIVTQVGASLEAGRDVIVKAGRDFTAVASRIDAKRDLAITAVEDLNISSAADERHSSSKTKKVSRSEDHVSQVSSVLAAGNDISLSAGKDLEITASRVQGGGNVALDAQRDLSISSALDEDASFYSKKSKGTFGRSSSKQQESYNSTNVASQITAGKDLTVNANNAADGGVSITGGRDVTIIGSQLAAGNDLVLGATNDVAVLSGVEEHGSYSKKTKSGFMGLSKSGKSQLKTSATQIASELSAGNDVVVASGKDIRLRASEIASNNDVELRAGLLDKTGDINLVSANDEAYDRSEEYKKKTGLSVSGGFLSISSAKEAGREAKSSTSVGSQVNATGDAALQAERDINIVGSSINAGGNVSLKAGQDVNVLAAENNNSSQDWEKNRQSGIGVSSNANGVTFFAGVDRTKEKNRLEQQTAAASQIRAGEDLTINAKRDINQVGSDLQAQNDINLNAGRDIKIDAARETVMTEQQRESGRNGLSLSLNHNYGSTRDAVNGAGKGEDGVSKASSTLKAADAVTQFVNGPTADVKFGNSTQTSSQQVVTQTNRASTFDAGNDLNISANNGVTINGAQMQAGRDINIKGRDVTLDVAKGSVSQESEERQSWAGIHGGTSGGFKLGVGGSYGVATEDGTYGSSNPGQVIAGRDINLDASNNANLIGTQVQAGRDIALSAGNELNIRGAKNASDSESNRHNGGGEVGLVFGSEGVGVYASVDIGKGNLERDGNRQQEAYLYAGDRLGFISGKDTNISGATLRGDEVVGRVGGNLNVSSVPDTGKITGKEFDLSATVTVGPGAGVSGSVGYGQTTGEKNWIEQQTSITGKSKVDIRTEQHTQLDGALIAADNGNLKLDTGTLGFSDIAGKDKEHGYYLNVGGSYSKGGAGAQDSSQAGKGGKDQNGWSVSGWNYEKDREQIARATVGAGEVVVRNDSQTGADSTSGLNRDVGKAYEVTKDEESRTDLYVTKSSMEAVGSPGKTLDQWRQNAALYGENSRNTVEELFDLLNLTTVIPMGVATGTGLEAPERYMEDATIKRQLSSQDDGRRAEGVRAVLTKRLGAPATSETEALVTRITDIGKDDPKGALQLLSLLAALNKPRGPLASNFVPLAVPLGYAALAALGVAVSTTAANPEYQQRMSEAANAVVKAAADVQKSAKEQAVISVAVWIGLIHTTFPIHLLDGENSRLITPILEAQGANPASGGYAGGAPIPVSSSTGGSQIADQTPTSYTRPVEELPAPGVMEQDEKETGKLPVPSDLPTNIHAGQQGKHIKGHNNFEEGRSFFNNDVDPAELLGGVHSGKYPIVGAGARGNPIVDFGRPIGIDGRTGQPVTKGQVHYGKNGAHIVPDARN